MKWQRSGFVSECQFIPIFSRCLTLIDGARCRTPRTVPATARATPIRRGQSRPRSRLWGFVRMFNIWLTSTRNTWRDCELQWLHRQVGFTTYSLNTQYGKVLRQTTVFPGIRFSKSWTLIKWTFGKNLNVVK